MIRSIVRKEIQVLIKEKGTFFWLFLLPVLFIVMFSAIFGNTSQTVTVRYYDADRTVASKELIQALGGIKGFELKQDDSQSLEAQIEDIRSGKLSSLVVVPAGYGGKYESGAAAEIELYRDAAEDTAVAPIVAMLNSVAAQYKEGNLRAILKSLGNNDQEIAGMMQPPLQVKDIRENAVKLSTVTQVVPGYTVMFVFFIMITMVRNFMRDRDSGMVSRLRGTPMKSHHYLIGMWVPNILVVIVQCTVLLLFGKLVYGLNLGDVAAVALIILSLAVCCTGIGLMLAMLVGGENQGIAFVQIITMGGAITGGLWFPYDFLPKAVQAVGRFTPQYWAQNGLQDIMIRGGHIGSVWINALILIAIGLAGFAVARLRFNQFAGTAVN